MMIIWIREAGLAGSITKFHSMVQKLRAKYPSYAVLYYTCQHLPTQTTHRPVRGDNIMSPSLLGVTVTNEE